MKLGDKAKDKISGYTGIIIALTEWISGLERVTIQSEGLHNGIPIPEQTFDKAQVEVLETNVV